MFSKLRFFGREKLYCTWIINKLLSHKPSCQATERTLPSARGQGACRSRWWVGEATVQRFQGASQPPSVFSFTHSLPQALSNVGMSLLFYTARLRGSHNVGVVRWSLGVASILKGSGFLWDSPQIQDGPGGCGLWQCATSQWCPEEPSGIS